MIYKNDYIKETKNNIKKHQKWTLDKKKFVSVKENHVFTLFYLKKKKYFVIF